MRQPSPFSANPSDSSHMGSYQENGTYISTASISLRRSWMPAWANTSLAHASDAAGDTMLRPPNEPDSDRIATPLIQATGPS